MKVDIPPGYTHNIENLGDTNMVTIMWANEPFDPQKQDTYYLRYEIYEEIKSTTVVGTRPEIIRLSCVINKLENSGLIEHIYTYGTKLRL